MSTINASIMSLNFNGNSSASAADPTNPAGTNTAFSEMLSMAEMSLSSTSGSQATGLDAIFGTTGQSSPVNSADAGGNFSQILALLQEIVSDLENGQCHGQCNKDQNSTSASTASTTPASNALSAGALQLMQEGGPLPTFLNEMDSQAGLSATQQESLWNIAAENMGGTPNTQTIRDELQQVGIPDTIPSSIPV